MQLKQLLVAGAIVAGLGLASAARADTATLAVQYFQVLDHTDPDFNVNTTPNVAVGSTLGANGLPVASSPFGVNDVDATTHEITWWSPTLNSNVSATGTGLITLPYASKMFPPNSTGTGNGTAFETAILTGNFLLAGASTVTFHLGSDDDSFIYVDGQLFGGLPGVHGTTNTQFTTPTLGAGSHVLKVFYADRQNIDATLSLSLDSTGVTINPGGGVPEPATWAMMLVGFAGLGLAMRRKAALAT